MLLLLISLSISSQLDEELERRKELGFNFMQVLRRQNELFTTDEDEREKHQVNFMSVEREISRILKEYAEEMNNKNEDDTIDTSLQNK